MGWVPPATGGGGAVTASLPVTAVANNVALNFSSGLELVGANLEAKVADPVNKSGAGIGLNFVAPLALTGSDLDVTGHTGAILFVCDVTCSGSPAMLTVKTQTLTFLKGVLQDPIPACA